MNKKNKQIINKILYFLPAIIWMVIIFYFSSQSTTGIGGDNLTQRFLILKSFHIIEYSILSFLLWLGFKKYKYAIIFGYLYALSDEFHQSFIPGRTGRFRDTLIDLGGILLGIILVSFFKKSRLFR